MLDQLKALFEANEILVDCWHFHLLLYFVQCIVVLEGIASNDLSKLRINICTHINIEIYKAIPFQPIKNSLIESCNRMLAYHLYLEHAEFDLREPPIPLQNFQAALLFLAFLQITVTLK